MLNNGITVRKLKESDYPQLIQFFLQAYGPNTVFQNIHFLKSYFSSRKSIPETACLVGVDEKSKKIVSHYGGLFYELLLNNKVQPLIWGVNAYTLPEWRGKGLNSQIVDFIHQNNEINGVIGMPYEAPYFYQKLGYHIFNKQTLSRYVYAIKNETFEVVQAISQNTERARKLLPLQAGRPLPKSELQIVQLTQKNIDLYQTQFDLQNITTTHRSHEFLKWRLIENPYIKYDVWAVVQQQQILAYTAIREEILSPQNFKISRIIDLFGQDNCIESLIHFIQQEAVQKNHIYIDFSAYGELYTNSLLSCHFTRLDHEDYSLIPLVTSPIENRPNHEFIVIQSKKYASELSQLNQSNTYFTRIDADRDRISRISQIPESHYDQPL